jgi:surfactin synthase thioesterase subunit
MSDRSQLPAAYGDHWSPKTDWSLYGLCICGAVAGQACADLRIKHGKPEQLWNPHKNRPLAVNS